jgi:chemotaxis protein MotB
MSVREGAVAALLAAWLLAGCGATSTAQTEENREQLKRLRRQARELHTRIDITSRRARALAERARALTSAMDGLSKTLTTAGITVTPRGAAVVVTMACRVLFGAGEVELKPEARDELKQIATLLVERFPERPVAIEGHSDASPPQKIAGAYPTNWELSSARALTVLRCLVEQGGLPPDRVHAVAYADTRPIAGNNTKEGRAENRRVEIVVMPHLETAQVSAVLE